MSYSITLRSPDGTENVIECESDQYILDAAEEAFAIADDRKSGSIKVVFDINV